MNKKEKIQTIRDLSAGKMEPVTLQSWKLITETIY
jgi:hypothetical protein